MFLYQEALGKRRGFSIMDKLLIRWELGLYLCPPSDWPLYPRLPSIHPSLPPSHPLPPLLIAFSPTLVSILQWLDIRSPKTTWLCLHESPTFDFSCSTLIFSLFLLYPSLFSLFSFTGLIICRVNTHTELNSISGSDGHFWQNTKCIS